MARDREHHGEAWSATFEDNNDASRIARVDGARTRTEAIVAALQLAKRWLL